MYYYPNPTAWHRYISPLPVQQAESAEVARLKHIIHKLQAGQKVDNIDDNGNPVDNTPAAAEEEPPADDGKVYDGY